MSSFDGETQLNSLQAAPVDKWMAKPDDRARSSAVFGEAEIQDACAQATARMPHDRLRLARELADAVERYLDRESDRARRQQLADEHTSPPSTRSPAGVGSTRRHGAPRSARPSRPSRSTRRSARRDRRSSAC